MAVVTITATGAGTWTAPVGVTAIIVECWGGGGAGGQRSTNNSGGGGGGGGSYSRVNALSVTGGLIYNYTVGIGGTDGTTPVNGGTTTFTGNAGAFCAAPGAISVTANAQIATAGAVAVNGDNVRSGGAGANGTGTISGGGGESGSPDFAGFNAAGVTGGTGRVDGGDGGNGRTTSADGFAGIQPGGGGGGGYRTTGATRNGGAGGAGQIRITYTAYFFPALGGTYGVTGADIRFEQLVPAATGIYSLTGGAVTFPPSGTTAKSIPISPGAYDLTGSLIFFGHNVPTLGTPYFLTGTDVTLLLGHRMVVAGDTYALTGTATPMLLGARIVLFSPSVTISTVGASQWLCPADVVTIKVEAWGGGAAGAQRSSAGGGAGGGGGEYSRRAAMAVTPGLLYDVVIGAAGTDGASPVAAGDTTFTADAGVQCVAKGAPVVAAESQTGGIGGTGGTGDTRFAGGVGANGTGALSGGGGEGGGNAAVGESGSGVTGGGGAGGAGGNGGAGKTTDSNGSPGAARGGGGGGGFQITGTRTGGAGGAGQIVITPFTAYALTDPGTVNLVPSGVTAKSMPAGGEVYALTGTTTPLSYGTAIFMGPAMVYSVTGPDIVFDLGTTTTGPRLDLLPAFYIYESFPATLASMVPGTPGVYTLTGVDATLRKGFSLVGGVGVGAYSYTGQTQTPRRTFPLVADPGVYDITDSELVEFAFNGVVTIIMPALGDTYTTVGATDVVLRYTRKVFPDEGDYELTLFDVVFDVFPNEAFVFPADPGVYDLLGSIAGTIYTPTNAFGLAGGAESGIYTITGSDTIPKRAVLPMPTLGTSYAITGAEITFPTSAARKLVADSGSYFINGTALNGRRRPKPGGGFDYIMGVSAKDSIIPQRRRRR